MTVRAAPAGFTLNGIVVAGDVIEYRRRQRFAPHGAGHATLVPGGRSRGRHAGATRCSEPDDAAQDLELDIVRCIVAACASSAVEGGLHDSSSTCTTRRARLRAPARDSHRVRR